MEKYISVNELEEAAASVLPKAARDYYKSGATDEYTLKENKRAFQRLLFNIFIEHYTNKFL